MARDCPITHRNLYDWFPCPDVENPYVGEPYWQLQSLGTLVAVQILRLVPEGPDQQEALLQLRQTIDTCLLAVPAAPDAPI